MGREARLNGGLRLGRKVAFGYPMGSSVTGPFHRSGQRLLLSQLQKPDRERTLAKEHSAEGLYVGANRQVLAEHFMEGAADWLLQIDTDIEFPVTIIEDMLEAAGDERQIVGAQVPLGDPRLGAHETVAYAMSDQPGIFNNYARMPSDLFECDAIATACIIIHRSVFERIAEAEGRTWFLSKILPASPAGTPLPRFRFRELGEDLSFSLRAREHGFSIWCAYVKGLKHYKVGPLSEDNNRTQLTVSAYDLGEMGCIVEEDRGANGNARLAP